MSARARTILSTWWARAAVGLTALSVLLAVLEPTVNLWDRFTRPSSELPDNDMSGTRDEMAETTYSNQRANSPVSTDSAGWFDAEGHREAIVYQDQYTPWADYPSFNLLRGTPGYGDQRAFFDVRRTSETQEGAYVTTLAVIPGDRLTFRIYVMNSADPAINSGPAPRGDSVNARVRAVTRPDAATRRAIYAYLSADNARPAWVADSVILISSTPVRLTPIPGSARLYSNSLVDGLEMDDFLVLTNDLGARGSGALIGSNQLDGVVSPGFTGEVVVQFMAEVTE